LRALHGLKAPFFSPATGILALVTSQREALPNPKPKTKNSKLVLIAQITFPTHNPFFSWVLKL